MCGVIDDRIVRNLSCPARKVGANVAVKRGISLRERKWKWMTVQKKKRLVFLNKLIVLKYQLNIL